MQNAFAASLSISADPRSPQSHSTPSSPSLATSFLPSRDVSSGSSSSPSSSSLSSLLAQSDPDPTHQTTSDQQQQQQPPTTIAATSEPTSDRHQADDYKSTATFVVSTASSSPSTPIDFPPTPAAVKGKEIITAPSYYLTTPPPSSSSSSFSSSSSSTDTSSSTASCTSSSFDRTTALPLLVSNQQLSTSPEPLVSDQQLSASPEPSTSTTTNMPPSTQFRQGSTSLSSSSSHQFWEPYPTATTKISSLVDRKPISCTGVTSTSLPSSHRPSLSLSAPFSPSIPSSLCSLKFPTTSAPSLCSPSSCASLSEEQVDVKELTVKTVSELLEEEQAAAAASSSTQPYQQHTILLLDMRPTVCFGVSTIKTAVSVSVPIMLLKRPMYSLSMVTEQLTTEREIEAFSRWREVSNIVLFDATGSVPVKGTPMFCIAQKFRKEGFRARIGYINGGYNAFQNDHRELCCSIRSSSPSSPSPSYRTPSSMYAIPTCAIPIQSQPRHRLHLGSLPAMMVKPTAGDTTPCQTPMIENPNVNPLFESVRQAMGLNTNITEEIPIRLPCGFSSISKVAQKRLPDWLCSVIQEDTGKTKLAEYFQKIETEEKKRLALLMLPQAMRSGRTTEYSIGAGIEKGLKNRYNNIWPFDHTRVKIREFPTSSDDYINASFLKSPLSGNKTYIATQGPLPSTFQDFWNVIWEQNSRVIVMLTREFEMGRIKCHRYWPTAQEPVLDLESVRVTFLSEYLPDGNDETVLVRQMKIGRPNSPQEQERTITQIQYTGWPDFGVPETPIEVLKIVKLANQHNTIDGNNNQASPYMSSSSNTTGPMVVHCSAGCGRTGAFCVIDSLLTEQQQQQGGGRSLPPTTDAVFQTVSVFREQRLSMVQTLRQYVFCYEALLWNLAFELSPHLSSRVLPSRATVMPIPTPHLTAFQPTKSTSDADFSYFG